MTTLHTLARQHIPQITHLPDDTEEALEAECSLWGNDSTLLIDSDATPAIAALQAVSAQLAWLDQHQSDILQLIAAHSRLAAPSQPQIAYAAFWLEDDTSFCDFAVCAANWGEQLAECALENGTLTFSQISQD
ncbi:MAG: hypothetical protein ACFNLD_04500 [Kingella oralis]|jgi:hypothetical protein